MPSSELIPDASGARYLEGGFVAFYREGKIFATRFDMDRLQLTGDAYPMVEDVADREEFPQFDLAANGILVYRRGAPSDRIVVRIDSAGKEEKIIAVPGRHITTRFSPDGSRFAAVDGPDAKRSNLIHDLGRGNAIRPVLDSRRRADPVQFH